MIRKDLHLSLSPPLPILLLSPSPLLSSLPLSPPPPVHLLTHTLILIFLQRRALLPLSYSQNSEGYQDTTRARPYDASEPYRMPRNPRPSSAFHPVETSSSSSATYNPERHPSSQRPW